MSKLTSRQQHTMELIESTAGNPVARQKFLESVQRDSAQLGIKDLVQAVKLRAKILGGTKDAPPEPVIEKSELEKQVMAQTKSMAK